MSDEALQAMEFLETYGALGAVTLVEELEANPELAKRLALLMYNSLPWVTPAPPGYGQDAKFPKIVGAVDASNDAAMQRSETTASTCVPGSGAKEGVEVSAEIVSAVFAAKVGGLDWDRFWSAAQRASERLEGVTSWQPSEGRLRDDVVAAAEIVSAVFAAKVSGLDWDHFRLCAESEWARVNVS